MRDDNKQLAIDVALLSQQVKGIDKRVESLEEDKKTWQKWCVRMVLKTGLSIAAIITLGSFWGYLSPKAQAIVEELLK